MDTTDKQSSIDISTDPRSQLASCHVGVVIPAYRVAAQIKQVIEEIPEFVKTIVVVDDCSPDNTSEIVISLNNSKVHLVQHKKNQGVGGAVLSGYKKALEVGAEIVLKLDGDGQMDPKVITHFILPIIEGKADYTKGNRFLHGEQLKSMPLLRRLGNWALSFLTKLASGYWNIFDPTNGYTAIHAKLLRLIDMKHIHHRYFFESSMLVELNICRAVVKDIPIPARYGEEKSSLSISKTLLQFPVLLIERILRRIKYQYFLLDFSACSLFIVLGTVFLLFGETWGLYHWALSFSKKTVATTGTVMIAVLPTILGFQLLIQALVLDIQNTPKEVIHRKC